MITKDKRPSKTAPCRVCGGHQEARKGSGARCYGFTRPNGWTVCTREESRWPTREGEGWAHPPSDTTAARLAELVPPPDVAVSECAPWKPYAGEIPFQRLRDATGWKMFKGFTLAQDDVFVARAVDGTIEGLEAVYRHPDPEIEKEVRPWTFGDDGWHMTARGRSGWMYGLDELAERPADPVLIVEGPKDREHGARIHFTGHVAIARRGGHGGLATMPVEHLTGRDVTIWPDADEVGRKAGQKLAQRLQAAGINARIVDTSALPNKWGLADDVPTGVDLAGLLANAAAPGGPADEQDEPPRWVMSSLSEVADMPAIPWLIEDTFRERGFVLLYGESGAGKSWTALDMALSIATGTQWGQMATRRARVLYLTLEDCKAGTLPRAKAWIKDRGISVPDDALKLIDEPVQLDRIEETMGFIRTVRDSGFDPELIIFDTLALSTAGIDENTAKDTGAVVGNVKRIQRELGTAVMLVHHAKKDEPRTYRGSTSWMAAVDTMIAVVKLDAEGPSHFTIECTKQRSAPRFGTTRWKLEPVPGVMWGDTPMVTTRYVSADLPGMPGNQAGRQSGKFTPARTNVKRVIERFTLDKGGATRQDIIREIGIKPSTLSGALDWLMAMGHCLYEPERELWHVSRESVPQHRSERSENTANEFPNEVSKIVHSERSENTAKSLKPALDNNPETSFGTFGKYGDFRSDSGVLGTPNSPNDERRTSEGDPGGKPPGHVPGQLSLLEDDELAV